MKLKDKAKAKAERRAAKKLAKANGESDTSDALGPDGLPLAPPPLPPAPTESTEARGEVRPAVAPVKQATS